MTATAQQAIDLADLVRQHQAGIWRYLRFLGADAPEADDLTQETFLAVMRSPFEMRSPRQTGAYLRTVARNCLLMARRKSQREVPAGDLSLAEEVWCEAAANDGLDDYLEALRSCLQSAVTDRMREAITARYRDGQSRESIAALMQLSVDGVKTMLRRARACLRDCVQRKLNHDR